MVRYAVEKDSLFLADPRSLMEGNFWKLRLGGYEAKMTKKRQTKWMAELNLQKA